jgi:hypothetical protein
MSLFPGFSVMARLFSAKIASATSSFKKELPESLWGTFLRWHPTWALTYPEPPFLEDQLSPGQSGCKADVDLKGLKPIMFVAWVEMRDIYDEIGSPCIITSGLDGKHSANSLHYVGHALDMRTRHLTAKQNQSLIVKTKRRLKKLADTYNEGRFDGRIRFDVVAHSSHLHIEADDA